MLRHETKMEKTQFAEYGRTRRDLAHAARGGGEVLRNMGYIGMCGPKG